MKGKFGALKVIGLILMVLGIAVGILGAGPEQAGQLEHPERT